MGNEESPAGGADEVRDGRARSARADLKLGFACNNRCLFCAQGEKRTSCDALPVEHLLARLVDVRRTANGLVLTGGEPTIHKKLLPLLRAARRLGFDPIQIQTNGRTLRYAALVDELCAAGATEFSPSLHGSTAAIHDALTRAPGSFDDSSAGIAEIARRGLPLVTNSVVTRSNLDDLPALVALLADLGVKRAQLALVHPVGTAAERFEEVVPRLSDVRAPIARAREVARQRALTLVTEAVPLCLLRGMAELAIEAHIPPTTVLDLESAPLDYERWRRGEGKSHGPPCETCGARAACEGPWREYPAAFGWDELQPFEIGDESWRCNPRC